MNEQPGNAKIKITIDESQHAKSFKEETAFYKADLEKARSLIEELVAQAKEGSSHINNDDNYFHQHNTISVLGSRGMGKTSFILSLRDKIENTEETHEINIGRKDYYKNNLGKPVWLPNLDPSRMEETETFLVTVVANILKLIQKKHTNGDLPQEIRNSLENLSHEFAVLAPAQVHEEQWKDLIGDPQSFAYEILGEARSGLNLAASFHKFLRACLKSLNAHVFIQPIDDVDSAIERGWPILETLRKYLATPCLITILSGDIDLYKTLVRKHQLDKLGNIFYKNELNTDEKRYQFDNQIAQLTEQYLAKIMPTHLRVHLPILAESIMNEAAKGEEYVELNKKSLLENEPFSEVYAEFSGYMFGPRNVDKKELLNSTQWRHAPLLPYRTRDFMRFLRILEPWYPRNNNKKKGGVSEEEEKLRKEKLRHKKEKALESLAHVFDSILYKGGISINNLLSLAGGYHLEWLTEYCLDKQKDAHDFWRLEPLYYDRQYNQCALLLQGFLFQSWKATGGVTSRKFLLHPDAPISYAIKVCLPGWMASSRDLTKNELSRMRRLVNVGSTQRHVSVAARSLAYTLRGERKWPTIGLGYVSIKLKEDVADENENLFLLRCFNDCLYRPDRRLFSCINIVTGLAFLVDVLHETPEDTEDGVPLTNLLNILAERRIWYIHPSGKNQELSDDRKGEGDSTIKPGKKGAEKWACKLKKWVKNMRDEQCERNFIPVPAIARAWRRFMHNLQEFEVWANKPDISCKLTVDEILERWVIAFLNALLVEEVIFKKGVPQAKVNLKHIVIDNEPFSDNLKQLNNASYAKKWMRCPMLLAFLRKGCREKVTKKVFANQHKEDNEFYKDIDIAAAIRINDSPNGLE